MTDSCVEHVIQAAPIIAIYPCLILVSVIKLLPSFIDVNVLIRKNYGVAFTSAISLCM